MSLYKRGRTYYLQFREHGKQVRTSLRTSNRKVAEEIRLRKEVELSRSALGLEPAAQTPAPPVEAAPPDSVAVEHVLAEYERWASAHKRPKTVKNDMGRLRALFAAVPKPLLGQVATSDVEDYFVTLLTSGRSPATLLRNREIAHAFWRWAVRQGHVERNVVSDIPRPRLPERDPVALSLDQVEELMEAVRGSAVEVVIATAVFAGLRREELCWLTWSDVDLDTDPGVLRVRAKTIDGEFWQPKTKRDRRVPLSPKLRETLQCHRAESRRRSKWLFPSPQGCRWDPDNLSAAIRTVLRRQGLHWNLLELRHTFGSQLARKGVSLLKIARLMGNSPAIASKHYINLVPEEMADDVAF